MSNYSKNLAGQRGHVFVGPASVEYTDDTTYALFVANAVEGEIGVFLEAGTVKTTALAATERFFIAQKRDGGIHKTPIILFSDIYRKARTAYSAPVRQVTYVGYNTSANDVLISFTGASSTNPLEFGLSLRDTTPNNQPFPVQEARVTVTSSTADEYTVIAQLVAILNGDVDFERTEPDRFAKAEIVSNGALTTLGQTLTVVNGSKSAVAGAAVSLAAGTKLSIAGTIYNVPVAVVAATAVTLDRPYQGTSATVAAGATSSTVGTMAYTSGTTLLGIRLTGLTDETHFLVNVETGLADAPISYSVAWAQGSGSAASVKEFEKEGLFFAGVGSTLNAEFSADYGIPTLFNSASVTYDQFFLEAFNSITPSAAPPNARTSQIERIQIAVPSTGTTPNNELQTIFAV